MGVKIVLARLPLPYRFWSKLGLFVHGDMDQPNRAFEGFKLHALSAGVFDESGGKPVLRRPDTPDSAPLVVLELGPGDSVFSGLIAASLGASASYQVDVGDYAVNDAAAFAGMLAYLRQQGIPMPAEPTVVSMQSVLQAAHASYLIEGNASLKTIPSQAVDYCFSNAVLQNVRRDQFADMARELARIVKPGGVCVHRVDLTDLLGGSLNNLRFSASVWESWLFRESGFYTNRLRHREMEAIFAQAGFDCELPRVLRWNGVPIPRTAMAAPFSTMSEDDLTVSGFDIVLRRRS